ncbi:MAG: KEOPS complex subunit Pcc1 [Candidatus Nanoarchaeia archaeon]|nr:KEOPS complex subunit Pcc1 [Candidatus Nanoarchaeia archaeon]MDD5054083.1 KEOPS complex subunit Pcc1 [Candidatus Nanoarchaeia archaeon]MDD5499521.1 KEOPS complex subunit Pcc1 [Candidatus Nanoarchaeia archaeon]
MNSARIVIKSKDSKKMAESLSPEMESRESERSKIEFKAIGDEFVIDLKAKDVNALKIVINHALRLVLAFNETDNISGGLK